MHLIFLFMITSAILPYLLAFLTIYLPFTFMSISKQ
jgi:hypothetical protein